jgi:hypothetical protein
MADKERKKANARAYYYRNREKKLAAGKAYRLLRVDEISNYNAEYYRKRKAEKDCEVL